MESLIQLLADYGYWGMFLSAFLAGSLPPFSSETVTPGLLTAGIDPVLLLVYGSIGNVLREMLNYGLDRLGKLEWPERYFRVKKESLNRVCRSMGGHGAWMGFFAFLPILGSVITIVLGLTRANIILSVSSITIGKVFRYTVLIWGASPFFWSFYPKDISIGSVTPH